MPDDLSPEWQHPESTLRGRMIREAWDAGPWITYAEAVAVVDALLKLTELASLDVDNADAQ